MSSVMEAQESGNFEQMSDRDKEIQASIWALILLVAEISLAFRTLRDRLHERGALLEEDEQLINAAASNQENMRVAYSHIEKAFRGKYSNVMEALTNPAEVTRQVQNQMEYMRYGVEYDPNDPNTPMVSGTYSEGDN